MSSSEGQATQTAITVDGQETVVATTTTSEPVVSTAEVTVTGTDEMTTTVEGVAKATSTRSRAQYLNAQFQQKSKLLRDMWAQHKMQLNKDQSQLLIILILSFAALVCSVAALSSNSWTCNSAKGVSFGLWNTCYMPLRHDTTAVVATGNATGVYNVSSVSNATTWNADHHHNKHGILCARQGLYDVNVHYAEQSHIDQITASQGLIISGAVLYLLSIVTLLLAYRFIQVNNLNSMRNALVTSMCVQIVSFCLQLVGFFLFILTDRLAGSISVLFIYFGLAIFVTNGINYYTIEYKTFKTRPLAA